MAYLKRQFKTIAVILVPLAVVVFLTSTEVKTDGLDGVPSRLALSYVQSGGVPHRRVRARLLHVGAHRLHRHEPRRARQRAHRGRGQAAARCRRRCRSRSAPVASPACSRSGSACSARRIIMIGSRTRAPRSSIGFGFGGSLLALFLRVGGGIFTKAADVGADLVGKVEAGIPEDDPRNPATIADNVGDNVGDCAGMAADLFESYEVTLVASIILGVPAFQAIFPHQPAAVGDRRALPARGPRDRRARVDRRRVRGARDREGQVGDGADQPRLPRRPASSRSSARSSLALVYVGNPKGGSISGVGWRMFGAVVAGLVLAQIASRITEYFTSTETKPVREIAESAATGGPATAVLSGMSSGLESSVWAIVAIAGAHRRRHRARRPRHPVLALPRRPHRHGHARHHRRGRVGGHVRSGRRQRGRHRRDVGRVRGRAAADHGEPRRGRQHHQGRHEGIRDRLGGHRRGRAVLLVHRDDQEPARPEHRRATSCSPNPLTVDQRRQPEDVHRPADRRLGRVPVLVARDPRGRPHRRRRGAGGAAPVRRRQDHERREASRLRPGHRHLHRRVAAGARRPRRCSRCSRR